MTLRAKTAILIFVVALVAFIARGSTAIQQSGSIAATSSDREILIDILSEIRKMNSSMRRSNLLSNNTQIAISSVQAQQSQVDRINRQLQNVQTELESAGLQKTEMDERVKLLSSQLDNESDMTRRAQFEDELRALKALVASHERHQQHLREEEERLTTQLQSEQIKLEVVVTKLASLERVMGNELSSETP